MEEFDKMLSMERASVERFVRFRLGSREDAEDVLQEIYFTAYRKFFQLKNRDSFKAWILSIARNKCSDYFRRKALCLEVPVEGLEGILLSDSRQGPVDTGAVRETLEQLGDKDKQILYLYYWKEMTQAEIGRRLNIPVGTVKSRLHTAKKNFKNRYPYRSDGRKGENGMRKMPVVLPDYKIEESSKAPFEVKWEELMGWFLIPKPGESLSWGMYEMPSRKCSHVYQMKATGRAVVHGIEGVELTAREAPYSLRKEVLNRTFVAQLTDTHCRYLAVLRSEGEVRKYITFLDGETFMSVWGFGVDNCGNETKLSPKGEIKRTGTIITAPVKEFLLDITGRYTVTINGKSYDTVCVMDLENCVSGVVTEQFLDQNGRTILWRRFNRDDWALEHWQKKWSEQLPENEQLTINGARFVQWYDCITDYIF